MERTLQKYGSYEKFEQATGGSLLTKSRIWNHVRKYMVKEGCLGEVSRTADQERSIYLCIGHFTLHMEGPGSSCGRPLLLNYKKIPYIIYFSWLCSIFEQLKWCKVLVNTSAISSSLLPGSYMLIIKTSSSGITREWHPSFPPFTATCRVAHFHLLASSVIHSPISHYLHQR